MNATLSPEGLMRGELLSPGPKLRGRTPGPRSVTGPADAGGMATPSCASPVTDPQPESIGNARMTRIIISVAGALWGELERIAGGAGEGDFGEPDVERGAYAHLAPGGEAAAV